jgi:uncharacterized membrane protein
VRELLLFGGVFLACLVEAVEALTIVLAVGHTRGWRSAWEGVGAGVGVLAATVAVLGPALTVIPINLLRLLVGALLLVFGLQWLRKAILRASGFKALHDEDALFAEQSARARAAARPGDPNRDWYAFTVAFKGVVLEGLEVAFIVVTFGASQGSLPLAVVAAVAAVGLVTAVGFAVRQPLSRVPENSLKFAVGLLLTSFGTFWAAEGAGLRWPGADVAILGLLAVYAVVALACVGWFRRARSSRRRLAGSNA